jgi:hypothetical protein
MSLWASRKWLHSAFVGGHQEQFLPLPMRHPGAEHRLVVGPNPAGSFPRIAGLAGPDARVGTLRHGDRSPFFLERCASIQAHILGLRRCDPTTFAGERALCSVVASGVH